MRNKIFILAVFGLLTLAGCENELKESVALDVSVTADGMTQDNDTIIVPASSPVTFNFAGDPDFISFYSGEAGYEYKNRERTQLSVDDIDCVLKFDSFGQYGTVAGAFKVYVSSSFGTLTRDKATDLDKLNAADTWVDISELCNLPTASSTVTKASSVSLADFLGKPLVLAFVYQPVNNTTVQPTWELQNIRIENTLKKTGAVTELPAMSMGFTPFDIYADQSIAYLYYKAGVQTSNAGVWADANISATVPRLRIQSSSAGVALNEDWLISAPLVLNSCLPDKGMAIKNTTVALDSYTYEYKQAGVYEVTFVASNGNMDHYSRVVRNVILKVVD